MRATPRSLVVLLWSLVALAPLGAGACHVGDDDPAADGTGDDGTGDDDGTSGPDAAPTDDGDDSGDDADDGDDDGGDAPVDVTLCRDLVPDGQLVDGHHEDRFDFITGSELGCNQASACHGASPGPAAPVYTIGGAIYKDLEGGQPVAGATVYVTDKNGEKRALVTSENGFFWSIEALEPPFQVAVTAGDCPTEPIKMLTNATGNCNSSGCHDSDYQIFSER